MNYRIHYSEELYHHGIKGMRWGVRKEYIPKGRQKPSGSTSRENEKRKGLSKNQKIAMGVAAVAVTGVVLYKTGQFDKIAEIGKNALKSNGVVKGIDITEAATPIKKATASEIRDKIDPIDGECNFNSFVGALANKFNVHLNPTAADMYENNVTNLLGKALKNPDDHIWDTIPADVYKDKDRLSNVILNKVAKGTDGAFGQIGSDLVTPPGARAKGHAFNWIVDNGQVRFYDTHAKVRDKSTGQIIRRALEDASKYITQGRISGKNGKITRLDNLEFEDFNLEYMNKLCDEFSRK